MERLVCFCELRLPRRYAPRNDEKSGRLPRAKALAMTHGGGAARNGLRLDSHCEERSDEAIFGEQGVFLRVEIATACRQASQ